MTTWKTLTPPPNYRVSYLQTDNSLFAVNHKTALKYSSNTDSWDSCATLTSHQQLHASYNGSIYNPSAIDVQNKIIYILYTDSKQMAINHEGKWKIINNVQDLGFGAQAIMIRDEFHVIGGMRNKGYKHLKWNKIEKKFENVHAIKTNRIWAHRLVKIKNKIIMMGGYDGNNYLNDLLEYDVINNKWTEMKVKLPKRMLSFGCLAVMKGKYILLFGGEGARSNEFDDIWIYCVVNGSFTKSTVKCPVKGAFKAFVITDELKDELSVYGFIRNLWKVASISEHLFPPQYLIKIIDKYHHNEDVHVISGRHSHFGKHWKMNVFQILSGL